MTIQRDRRFRIGVFSNPSQLVAGLMAVAYLAFRLYFVPPLGHNVSIWESILSTNAYIAIAILAIICFLVPVRLMFLATVPILYLMLPSILLGIALMLDVFSMDGFMPISIFLSKLIIVVVVLSATAYSFKGKKLKISLLVIMFMTLLGLLAFYNHFERNIMPVNLEFLANLILYISIIAAVRAIANGKNIGTPVKDITATYGHTGTQLDRIVNSDILPVVDADILQGMARDIKSEYYPSQVDYGEINRGLFVMDSLANRNADTNGDGFRRSVLERWAKYQYRYFTKRNIAYRILTPLLWIISLALILFSLVPMIGIVFPEVITFEAMLLERVSPEILRLLENIEMYVAVHIIALIIGLLLFPPVSMGILKNFIKRPGNKVEIACLNTPESVLCQFVGHRKTCNRLPHNRLLEISSYLDKICVALGEEPERFKENFGKQTGGGSHYHGWGSGSAIGAGLLFTAISQANASSKNNAINVRIKALKTFAYYNNVVSYFYDNVFNNCNVEELIAFVPVEDDGIIIR